MKKIIVKNGDRYMNYDEFSPTVIDFFKSPKNITLFDSIQQAADFMEEFRHCYSGPYKLFEITLP